MNTILTGVTRRNNALQNNIAVKALQVEVNGAITSASTLVTFAVNTHFKCAKITRVNPSACSNAALMKTPTAHGLNLAQLPLIAATTTLECTPAKDQAMERPLTALTRTWTKTVAVSMVVTVTTTVTIGTPNAVTHQLATTGAISHTPVL